MLLKSLSGKHANIAERIRKILFIFLILSVAMKRKVYKKCSRAVRSVALMRLSPPYKNQGKPNYGNSNIFYTPSYTLLYGTAYRIRNRLISFLTAYLIKSYSAKFLFSKQVTCYEMIFFNFNQVRRYFRTD